MPTFIEEPFATNSDTLSVTVPDYVPAESQKVVQTLEVFRTQSIAELTEDTVVQEEEVTKKAKKTEWLRMYFLGYI